MALRERSGLLGSSENIMFKTSLLFLIFCATVCAQTASGQASNAPPRNVSQDVTFVTTGLAVPGAPEGPIGIIAHQFSFDSGKPVTGAPYSAERVTEHEQTLPDGNRIVNTTTTKTYRDSQGRTRTETSLPALAGGPVPATMISIHDPVAGVTYLLNSEQRTAQKMATKPMIAQNGKALPLLPPPPPLPPPNGAQIFIAAPSNLPKPDVKTEDLGSQTLDGVVVTGTRVTQTIPAGAIGNELPIETVSERWFSPALQIFVKSTNTDPRIGQTTETLKNLSRAEPDPALFQVPSDYTITEPKEPGPNTFVYQKQN
jgi:hypothetical protein